MSDNFQVLIISADSGVQSKIQALLTTPDDGLARFGRYHCQQTAVIEEAIPLIKSQPVDLVFIYLEEPPASNAAIKQLVQMCTCPVIGIGADKAAAWMETAVAQTGLYDCLPLATLTASWLRRYTHLLQQAIHQPPASPSDIILIFELEPLTLVYTSQPEYLGHQIKDIFAWDTIESLIHPEDIHTIHQAWDNIIAGQANDGLTNYRIQHRDGHWEWIQSRHAVFSRHADGSPKQIILSQSLISHRHAVEVELQALTWRLQVMHEIDRAILTSQSPKTIAAAVLPLICQLKGVHRASITILERQEDTAVILAYESPTPDRPDPVWTDSVMPISAMGDIHTITQIPFSSIPDIPASDLQLKDYLTGMNLLSLVAIPLTMQGNLIGILTIFSRDKAAFNSASDLHIITELAAPLAIAIHQARLLEQSQQQARELLRRERFLSLLNDITQKSLTEDNITTMISSLTEPLANLFSADGCHITLWDENLQVPVPIAAYGLYAKGYTALQVLPGQSTLTGAVLEMGRVLVVPNVKNSDLLDPHLGIHFPGLHAVMVLPLIANVEKMGAALLLYKGERPFTDNEISRGEQVAAQLALAIAKSQLLLTEKQQRSFSETIRQVASSLNSTLDLNQVLDLILEHLSRVVNYDSASVMLLQETELTSMAYRSIHHTENTTGKISFKTLHYPELPHLAEVIESKMPVIINDTNTDDRWIQLTTTSSIRSWLGVPLVYKGSVRGLMNISKASPHFFNAQHALLARFLADHAVVALENARLFEATRRQLDELQILHAIARVGTEAFNEDELIAEATAVISQNLYTYNFGFLTYDAKTDRLHPHYSYHYHTPQHHPYPPFSPRYGIAGQVIRTGQPRLITDVTKEAHYLAIDSDTRSEICVPLRVNSRIIGIVNAESPHIDGFTDDDLRLLITLAGQMATAIEKTRLLAAERMQRQEAEQLRKATAALTSSLELEDVLTTILEQLQTVVAFDSASVMLDEGEHLRVVAARGFPKDEAIVGQTFPINDSLMTRLRETKRPYLIHDAQKDPRFQGWGNTVNIRGWIGVPLLVRDEMIGYLTLDSKTQGKYGRPEAEMALAFANQAATAIANARLYQNSEMFANNLQNASTILARLNSTSSVTQILPEIADILKQMTGCHVVTLLLNNGPDYAGFIIPVVGSNFDLHNGMHIDLHETSAHDDIQNGRIHVTRDFSQLLDYPVQKSLHDNGLRSGLTLPMVTQDEVIGALNLFWTHTNGPQSSQFTILEQIARAVALGIERSQMVDEISYRAQQLAILHDIGRQITGLLDSQALYDLVVTTLVNQLGYDQASVMVIDKGQQELVLQAVHGIQATEVANLRQPLTNNLDDWMAQEDKAVVVHHTSEQPDFWQSRKMGALSEMVLPLRAGSLLMGLLVVSSTKRDAFNQRDTAVITILANQLAVALEKARLFEETRRHAHELEIIADISTSLREARTVFEMVPIILQKVVQLVSATQVSVLLRNQETGILEMRGVYPASDVQLTPKHPNAINEQILATGQPYLSPALVARLAEKAVGPHGASAAVEGHCVRLPLRTQDRTIGILQLRIPQNRTITQQDIRLLTAVSDIAGGALDRAIVLESLEERVESRTRELAQANNRLKELDRLKSKFVSDVSHELRTPVTNLSLYLDLLEHGSADKQSEYLQVLRKQAKRLNQLINDILDLSRLEISATQVQIKPVSLNDIVEPVITAHQPRIELAGLTLTLDLTVNIPLVLGERNQLAQVATNLLSNSINYTPKGTVSVRTYWNKKRKMVALEVADTGIGIDTADHSHLFDRFYRGNRVSQLNIPGTGLGLAIVAEIVKLHNGTIEFSSSPNMGTTFTIWLPVAV